MSHLVGQKIQSMSRIGLRFASSSTPSSSPVRVGFIGLGNMGANMAMNLIKKGHQLTIYDVQSASAAKFDKLGATIVSTPAELAEKSDRIITMLPASPHVRSAFTSPDGILSGIKPGTIAIDCSTIDPDVSKDLAVLTKEKEASFADAPVSGGVVAASAGTLTFMVGASKPVFDEVEPLLLKMGSKVVLCGSVGSGGAAKICNNMLLAISMIGTAETMNLGIRMGLDPKLLASILNSSSGRCWSSEMYNPVPGVTPSTPASNGYKGGFGTALMTKDLGLAQNAAQFTATPTPLGSLSHQLYRMMCLRGLADKDFSSIFQFLQEGKNGA